MEQLLEYVRPELLVLVVVLYFVGKGIDKTGRISEKYVPLILGVIGIGLCAVWVTANSCLCTVRDVAMALFTAVVQGILVAGLSVGAWNLICRNREK